MTQIQRPFVALFALSAAVLLWISGGCGGNKNSSGLAADSMNGADADSFGDDATVGGSSSGPGFGGGSRFSASDSGSAPNCPPGSPLSCFVNLNCTNGAQTTLSGKVFDPAGNNPIFNVVVFVPNDPNALPPITPGTNSCSTCDTSVGDYVTATLTDNTGSFTLKNVPTGDNFPLVIQIGKWRRTLSIPSIKDCATTTVPNSGAGQLRLPRNQQEGDMPQMALLTGGLDDLGCFLTKVGLDAKEYSAPGAGGRLDVYQGLGGQTLTGAPGRAPGLSTGTAGNCTNTSCPLWASKRSFESYDIVFLACEGNTDDPDDTPDGGGGLGQILGGGGGANVTKVGKQAMHDWLDEGGKVFATHFHYTWFKNGPPAFPIWSDLGGWRRRQRDQGGQAGHARLARRGRKSVRHALSLHVVQERSARLSVDRDLARVFDRQWHVHELHDRHHAPVGPRLPGVAEERRRARGHRDHAVRRGRQRVERERGHDDPMDLREQRSEHRRERHQVPLVRNAHRRGPRGWRRGNG